MDETTPEPEEWRPLPGYAGSYEVSSLGRARSLDRVTSGGRHCRGKMLSLIPGKGGYLYVHPSRDGFAERAMIHQSVCEAWHGPRPDGLVTRHLDGNKLNNTPGNLRWGTPKENAEDMRRHGTNFCASKTHCPAGHPYSGDNLITDAASRKCHTCLLERSRRRWEERSEELNAQARQRARNRTPEQRALVREDNRIFKEKRKLARNLARAEAGLLPILPNAAKTHCKRGHPLSGENLLVDKRGRRSCRICSNERERERRRERYATDPEYAEKVRASVRQQAQRKRDAAA